jgi:hypothetical protein
VVVREFMMDPDWFFIQVQEGVVVVEGRVERRSLLPPRGPRRPRRRRVVRVENRLAYEVDDLDDIAHRATYSWLGP